MPSPDEVRMQRDEIHRLRGAFLDTWVEVESQLALAICLYFSVPKEKSSRFNVGVLSRLGARGKIDLFSKVTKAKESPYLKQLVGELRRLNAYRNGLAHSSLFLDAEFGGSDEDPFKDFEWTTAEWNDQDGIGREAIDLHEMQRQLDVAETIVVTLLLVNDEIAKAPSNELDPGTDWPQRLQSSMRDGIPEISDPLFNYLQVLPPKR